MMSSLHVVAQHDAHRDSKRPIFHPLAARGWSSDPCGPVFFKGRYHLFWQHQHRSCQWYWGLCWDHVVSEDLIHWRNLPPAVVPTPGGLDADGCFSGTVEVDPELGVPVILHTGVYLKTNTEAVAAHGLPPPEHDPGTRFVEKQLAAVPADPNDPDLTYWTKLPCPVMSLPPRGLNISCWRDAFCLQRPAAAGGEGDEWVVLLASGIRGVGGAVLRFRSKHFTYGWRFDGIVADGDNAALGLKEQDWECPILAQLPSTTKAATTAAFTAATPAAIAATTAATAAKTPLVVSWAAPLSPSSSTCSSTSSRSIGADADACPSTPLLQPRKLTATASVSTLSGFGGSSGSSASLAAVDDAASNSSGSNAAAAAAVPSSATSIASVEPVAAASAAAAAAAEALGDSTVLIHPAVSVDAWVEHQTQQQQQAQAAAVANAVAAMAAVACDVRPLQDLDMSPSSVTCVSDADLTTAFSSSNSSSQLTVLQQEGGQNLTLSSIGGSSGSSSSGGSSSGSSGGNNWMFCVSPDACNNPITYWLGGYDGRRFDVSAADGPHQLDLGTTLYAATLWQDPQGRQLLYGWIQEHRRVPTPPMLCDHYSYAGCISTPRVLQLVDGRLWQTPLPELSKLRTSVCWHAEDVLLCPNSQLLPLQVVGGTHLDINITLQPPATYAPSSSSATAAATYAPSTAAGAATAAGAEASSTAMTAAATHSPSTFTAAAAATAEVKAGLVFKSWRSNGKGAATLSFNWASQQLLFDFDEPFPDAYNPHPHDTPERRRVGGRLRNYVQGEPLSLRVLLDGSAVEVFTSTRETLTTRIYRGHPPKCKCFGCDSPAAATAAVVTPAAVGTAATTTAAAAAAAASSSPAAAATAAEGGAAHSSSTLPTAGSLDDETGISLFATGAGVTVSVIEVWEMGSCWVEPGAPPPQPPALLQQQQLAVYGVPLGEAAEQASEQAGAASSLRGADLPAAAAAAAADGGAGLPAAAAADGGASLAPAADCGDVKGAGTAAASPRQQQHAPAGEQAAVKRDFLQDMHIQAK